MAEHSEHHSELGHIVPFSTYRNVFLALVVLTVFTVAIAQVDFGNMNLVIAMVVASFKAGIVAMYFMHLKYENPITWLYVFFPLFLLALMIGLIFLDNPLRGNPEEGTFIGERIEVMVQEKADQAHENPHHGGGHHE